MNSSKFTHTSCFQIDVINASSVKVLQVGQPRNILKELHMTPNQYNWVQSIYYVCQEIEKCCRYTSASHIVIR